MPSQTAAPCLGALDVPCWPNGLCPPYAETHHPLFIFLCPPAEIHRPVTRSQSKLKGTARSVGLSLFSLSLSLSLSLYLSLSLSLSLSSPLLSSPLLSSPLLSSPLLSSPLLSSPLLSSPLLSSPLLSSPLLSSPLLSTPILSTPLHSTPLLSSDLISRVSSRIRTPRQGFLTVAVPNAPSHSSGCSRVLRPINDNTLKQQQGAPAAFKKSASSMKRVLEVRA